jgi:hypothetical protein
MPDVCQYSGLPQDECDYTCRHCRLNYTACPDPRDIAALAEQLRENWPECRLRKNELYVDAEIPTISHPAPGKRRRGGGSE